MPCTGYGPEHWVIYHCWYLLSSANIGGGKCMDLEIIPTHPTEGYLKFQGGGDLKSQNWIYRDIEGGGGGGQTKTFYRRSMDIFWDNKKVPRKFRV